MPSKVDLEKCTGCGTCLEKCPEEAITMEDSPPPVVNDEKCTECGICVIACPSAARDIAQILHQFT